MSKLLFNRGTCHHHQQQLSARVRFLGQGALRLARALTPAASSPLSRQATLWGAGRTAGEVLGLPQGVTPSARSHAASQPNQPITHPL